MLVDKLDLVAALEQQRKLVVTGDRALQHHVVDQEDRHACLVALRGGKEQVLQWGSPCRADRRRLACGDEIPRSIDLKKLELKSLKDRLDRDQQTLADLEHDRSLFEFKAPSEGWFYHGPIENGRWTTGRLLENVVIDGHPPVHRPFATFIPAGTPLCFEAFRSSVSGRAR